MALSIGVHQGSNIRVGKNRVKVEDILTPTLLVVSIDGGQEITVSDQERVEVLPEVFVSAGIGSKGAGNRLVFEAPRRIPIHREEAA